MSKYARAWKALAKRKRARHECALVALRGMDDLAEHRAAELRKLRDGVRAEVRESEIAGTMSRATADRLRALLEGT